MKKKYLPLIMAVSLMLSSIPMGGSGVQASDLIIEEPVEEQVVLELNEAENSAENPDMIESETIEEGYFEDSFDEDDTEVYADDDVDEFVFESEFSEIQEVFPEIEEIEDETIEVSGEEAFESLDINLDDEVFIEDMEEASLELEVEDPLNLAAAEIPSDAIEWNGHYYKVFREKKTPKEADEYCKSLGGYLATLTSGSEKNVVVNAVNTYGDHSSYLLNIRRSTGNYLTWGTGEESANVFYPSYGSSEAGEYYMLGWYTANNYPAQWGGYRVAQDSTNTYYFICEWGDQIDH